MKIKYLTLIIFLSICSFGGCSMGQGVTTNITKQKTTSIVIDSNNYGENNAKDYSDLEGKIESLPPNEELNVNYCNEKPYKDLITIQYPAGLFERLTEKFKKDTEITYAELSKEFKFECIRKAGSCYYVILMEDDGKKTFLFFKENLGTR